MVKSIAPSLTVPRSRLFVLVLALLFSTGIAHSQIVYVNPVATGNNSGSSWANAFTTLSGAIALGNSDADIREIRVAGGTYRESELVVTGNYRISGRWNSVTNSQDISVPATVLDGQLQHRILRVEAGAWLQLNSIEFLRGGMVPQTAAINGGGILNKGNIVMENCVVKECEIARNVTFPWHGNGSGICNEGQMEITLTNFTSNKSETDGGAIFNTGSIVINGCNFFSNSAISFGGAIYNGGNLKVFRSRFHDNIIVFQPGPALVNGQGGAIANRYNLSGTAEIVSCIFDKNRAHGGGAISSGFRDEVINNTFYANEAYTASQVLKRGGAILVEFNQGPLVYNNIFWSNISIDNAAIYLAGSITNGSITVIRKNLMDPNSIYVDPNNSNTNIDNNIFWDPQLKDPENGDFRPIAGSQAIDNGDNAYYTDKGYPGADWIGFTRLSTCNIDMGAIEFQYDLLNGTIPDNNGILYVDVNSTYSGPVKGASWMTALTSLKQAIEAVNMCPATVEIRVAGGVYQQEEMNLTRSVAIRGGFSASTGEQNWVTHPTIFQNATNGPLLNIFTTKGETAVEGCWFVGGRNTLMAGGLTNAGNLRVNHCRFQDNRGFSGGAVLHADGKLNIYNCEFINNTADQGGGIYIHGDITITNCSFNNNTAREGNGIYVVRGFLAILHNNIFWGNAIPQITTAGVIQSERNLIRNFEIIPGGQFELIGRYSISMQDPLFTDATDLRIRAGSPAINNGVNHMLDAVANGSRLDLSRLTRIYDDVIDLGAHERQMKQIAVSVDNIQSVYGDDPLRPLDKNKPAVSLALSSDNDEIAEPFTDSDGHAKLRIRKKGTVRIYASFPGDAEYDPSPSAGFTLTINPKPITITADAASKIYGEADPALTYTISTPLVSGDAFTGSLNRAMGEDVATYPIQQNDLALNDNYITSFTGAGFTINKKDITVTANTHSKVYGEDDPPFTYTIAPALINNDVLNGSLSRTSGEQAGIYPITVGTLDHQNYAISFDAAQFTIGKATQQINWNQVLQSDCNGSTTLTLQASSNSGLPVSYHSSNTAVATISGNQLNFVAPGIADITASQPGDINYEPAGHVTLDLSSKLPAHLIKKHWDDVLFFDNSSNQFTAWQWYKNGLPVSSATGQYLYESGKLNGAYYATAKNAAGIALPTCPVDIVPGPSVHPVTVSPNPLRAGQQVRVKASFTQQQLTGAVISVFNVQGNPVAAIQNVTPDTAIHIPAFAGIYVVKLTLASGATYSTNILVKP